MSILTRLIRAALLALCFVVVGVAAQASEWQRGDVFVAVGNGQYQVYRQTGTQPISPMRTFTNSASRIRIRSLRQFSRAKAR